MSSVGRTGGGGITVVTGGVSGALSRVLPRAERVMFNAGLKKKIGKDVNTTESD
jgi:hypothetical protein